jgi:uncharacterized RDD family membrane protein YckC
MVFPRRSDPAFPSPGESLDSVVTVETPEGIEFTLFPAGPLIRGCAWGIDTLIQWFLIMVILAVSNFFNDGGGSWGVLLLFFCIDWFYHTGWEVFCRGQSPGKRLMGIRVVRGDGSPVNPGASFLRNLLRFADTFLFLCPIALLTMLISRGCRRLGDWVGGTLVVYTAQSLPVSILALGLGMLRGGRSGSGFTRDRGILPGGAASELPPGDGDGDGFSRLGPPLAITGEERQGILMFARRYPLLGRARANEIAAPYVRALWNVSFWGDTGDAGGSGDGGDARDAGDTGLGSEEPLPFPAAEYLLDMGRRIAGDR